MEKIATKHMTIVEFICWLKAELPEEWAINMCVSDGEWWLDLTYRCGLIEREKYCSAEDHFEVCAEKAMTYAIQQDAFRNSHMVH